MHAAGTPGAHVVVRNPQRLKSLPTATLRRAAEIAAYHSGARADGAVYLRGTDPDPPCYVLTRGAPGVNAIAFEADGGGDLEKISAIDGACR